MWKTGKLPVKFQVTSKNYNVIKIYYKYDFHFVQRDVLNPELLVGGFRYKAAHFGP